MLRNLNDIVKEVLTSILPESSEPLCNDKSAPNAWSILKYGLQFDETCVAYKKVRSSLKLKVTREIVLLKRNYSY